MKQKKLLILLICLLILSIACTCGLLPEKEKPVLEIDEDGSVEVNATGAAQSEFALQTQIADIEATRESLAQNIEGTAQVLRPTDDPSDPNALQATATPIDAGIYTTPPAPGSTTLSVSVNTNCRSGPGIAFEAIDSVLAGQEVEVLGVDASGAYYIVRSPNGSICWLWSNYATVQGNEDSLAVMTPPAPPQTVNINDWQDMVVIQPSEDFTWQGHWIVGYPGGQSLADWHTANLDVYPLEYYELDISRHGNFLDVEVTWHFIFEGSTNIVERAYGVAQVSEDNTMAVGSFYLSERIFRDERIYTVTHNDPFLWYQNGNPNQFIGDFNLWVPCAAREGAAFPVPCNWP